MNTVIAILQQDLVKGCVPPATHLASIHTVPAGYEAEDGGWQCQVWPFARTGLHVISRKAQASDRGQYCTLKGGSVAFLCPNLGSNVLYLHRNSRRNSLGQNTSGTLESSALFYSGPPKLGT